MIKRIPLSRNAVEDKLVWPFVYSGSYSVKSGYNFLSKERDMENQFSSNPDPYRGLETNLGMKVLTVDVCEHCKQFPEDVIHALWLCPEVLTVWSSNLMWSFRQTKHFPKILDLVKHVKEENKDLDAFAMIIWTFWFQRNRLRIEDKPFPIIDVIPMANNILAEFIKAILVQSNDSSAVGLVLASMAENILLPHTVIEVEALAIVKALSFAQELGFLAIVLEGDSEVIIKALSRDDESFTSYGHLIAEAKLFSDTFVSLSFSHIRKQGNSIAHNLVRHVNDIFVGMKDIPTHLNNVLLANFH
ncbi:uncharacterized protein LOC142616276 [Castanea sativa]|uniref:uncharacterized protein LOC142616276 n=1 Tax=Castanea sativa TaxID=21020 RepID=UPI003F64B3F0